MAVEIEAVIFIDRGGELENYQELDLERLGGVVPQIGDEITQSDEWIGRSSELAGNVVWIVKRRVWVREGRVALVCDIRPLKREDYELFF